MWSVVDLTFSGLKSCTYKCIYKAVNVGVYQADFNDPTAAGYTMSTSKVQNQVHYRDYN